jgi:hypothetical protein
MKIIRLLPVALIVLFVSCGGKTNNNSEKGKWSQKERTEYMRDCISSAKKSYEDRGAQPDSAIITTLCKCSGEIIEERYAYDETSRIDKAEIKTIMQQAVEKCLKK